MSSAPLAIGIALIPPTIVALIVLPAQGSRRGALGFLFGWVVKADAAEPLRALWRRWMMVFRITIMNDFGGTVCLVKIVQGVSR